MTRTVCGFGSVDDPDHLRQCIACNRWAWREYRRRHPTLVRRVLGRLLDWLFGDALYDDTPLPPDIEEQT